MLAAPGCLGAGALAGSPSAVLFAAGIVPGTPATVPPGVDAALLAPRAPDDPRAFVPLDGALAQLAEGWPDQPSAVPAASGDPEDGLRAYAKGRDAAAGGRWLMAATELEKARASLPASPEVARLLAHAYLQVGSPARAGDELLRAQSLDPSDPRLAVEAATVLIGRRQTEAAASVLARAANRAGGLSALCARLDPEMRVAAPTALAEALREEGWDTAFVESTRIALAALDAAGDAAIATNPRLGVLHRRRAETNRAVGDALCRLGRFDEAVAAFDRAAELPNPDPAALRPRVAWALLEADREPEAVTRLVTTLNENIDTLRDADGALATWLLGAIGDPDPLQEQLQAIAEAHPESGPMLRAIAGQLPPKEAADLIEAHLAREGGDTSAVGRLIQLLAAHDLRRALAVAARLVEDDPQRVGEVVTWLYLVPATPTAALDAARALPPSSGRSAVLTALLLHLENGPEAWTEAMDAWRQWPADPLVHVTRLAAARQLQESWLLADALTDAEAAGFLLAAPASATAPPAEARVPDLAVSMSAAVACSATGLLDRGVEIARAAVEAHPDASQARTVLAEALLRQAEAPSRSDQERFGAIAAIVDAAEQAIERDPSSQPAWSVLLALYDPRTGLLPDAERRRATLERIAAMAPDSLLARFNAAAIDLAAGRFSAAADKARELASLPQSEQAAVEILITALARDGRLDEADRWLRQRLEEAPLATPPLAALVVLLGQTGRMEEAEAFLQSRLATEPADLRPAALLDDLWRRTGRSDLACRSGRERALRRPEGSRRALELAAFNAECGDGDAAATELRWLLERFDRLTRDEALAAVGIAQRLDDFTTGRDELVQDLCTRFGDRYADAPLAIASAAAVAATRLSRPDEAVLAIVDQALRSREGSDPGPEGAERWIALAQALVDAHRPDLAAEALRRRVLDGERQQLPAHLATATASLAIDASAGDAASSMAFLRQLVSRDGDWPPSSDIVGAASPESRALFWLSTVHSIVGEERAAAAVLEEVIRIDPAQAMARNNLGFALLDAGRLDDRIVDLIETAQAELPDDPSVLDSLGWLRYAQGRIDDDARGPGAVSLLSLAAERSGGAPSTEMLDHLGDALWRAGREAEAQVAWAAAYESTATQNPRERMLQVLAEYQQREFGLVVRDPREIFDRQFGELASRLARKLEQVRSGLPPAVAPSGAEAWTGG
ncbi:MAG: hypothetical protein KDA22_11635 [Phycisphaerales bacterium]|nr:hypothetical protein [Phycisphaerales bacterium]